MTIFTEPEFSYEKILAWAQSRPRRPAHRAFTDGVDSMAKQY